MNIQIKDVFKNQDISAAVLVADRREASWLLSSVFPQVWFIQSTSWRRVEVRRKKILKEKQKENKMMRWCEFKRSYTHLNPARGGPLWQMRLQLCSCPPPTHNEPGLVPHQWPKRWATQLTLVPERGRARRSQLQTEIDTTNSHFIWNKRKN